MHEIRSKSILKHFTFTTSFKWGLDGFIEYDNFELKKRQKVHLKRHTHRLSLGPLLMFIRNNSKTGISKSWAVSKNKFCLIHMQNDPAYEVILFESVGCSRLMISVLFECKKKAQGPKNVKT
jgi:hypothetical protein